MFQCGNREWSNLCLVLAGDLPTAHGFCLSLGGLAGLGVVQLQVRNNVLARLRVRSLGCCLPGVKLSGTGLPFKADSWKWVKKQEEG